MMAASISQQAELIWSQIQPSPVSSGHSEGALVQFAQFDNTGVRIRLIRAHTRTIRFFAISHVWGDIAWRTVRCCSNEILTSASKARFIDERLFGLVGETPFWMDTVTVNQRDQAEVISTVQAIPDIFKDAEKTIAITEGDGFEPCCATAVHGFKKWEEFDDRLKPHFVESHGMRSRSDSYLRRLWTLQEVILSHTIHFVAMPQEWLPQPAETDSSDLLLYGEGWLRVRDALNSLSSAFAQRSTGVDNSRGSSPESEARSVDFIRAYIEGGMVSSTKVLTRNFSEDIFSDSFTSFFWASERIATKARDYVFATMPQFPWYRYPPTAESMTFSHIFSDLAQKASRAGHPFTSRFLEGMTGCSVDGNVLRNLWKPSNTQPESECLGDFVKLLGYRVDDCLEDQTTPVHFAAFAIVNVWPSRWGASGRSCLDVIRSAISFSSDLWTMSHRVGELSKYGSNVNLGDLQPFAWNDVVQWRCIIRRQPVSEAAIFLAVPSLTKVLDLLLGAVDEHQINKPMQGDWALFEQQMLDAWHPQMQQALLLMTAMISCRVPLSAFKWMYKRFWPVTLALLDGTTCIGMVAWRYVFRFATMTSQLQFGSHTRRGAAVMIAAQHHSDARLKGKDLALVDPYTKIPIGLLPDFTRHFHDGTSKGLHALTTGLTKLYGNLVTHTPDGGFSIIECPPLEKVNIPLSARKMVN
ncbi:uncharacterized protein CLAFUR5_04599 [Fulvia fulva]|uniref:Heterokaryon incompatibility domain-containing protein n=1 Tax=Passalora fulva TaxID=5499 RepID=A0A9Q8LGG3_PASFU|nr:uncharacterized protein CLAFUR5_04599 [Fulvia fulva]KAK4628523.1 hypothetical protein CLAFUR0_04627 [Fulvia fulva]UJO16984.1 hypothetical protein CLAFUR5_04599 [Fulvia fulva]WPV29230.1 hypothetical protein CLAFUW7_04631 [Fulvia fulva]